MCQVTPFTLPCCRRIYVSILKLPSCPTTWPKSKCPAELCIQLGGYEAAHAQHRELGTCWRCDAHMAGVTGYARERLRPGVDKAFIVPGLEELSPADRRKLAEADGKCWFCGTKGCDMCGGRKFDQGSDSNTKRPGLGSSRLANKRLKTENYSGTNSMSSTILSDPYFQSHQQIGYLQPHMQPGATYDYGQGRSSTQTFSSLHRGDSACALPTKLEQESNMGYFDSVYHAANAIPSSMSPGRIFDPVYETATAFSTNIDPTLLNWPVPEAFSVKSGGHPADESSSDEQAIEKEYQSGLAEFSGPGLSSMCTVSTNSVTFETC